MIFEEDIFANSLKASNIEEIDESLWNLTLQDIQEEESKSLENIKMKHICGPATRSKLIQLTRNRNKPALKKITDYLASKSVEKYKDKKPTLESIFYQTTALSIWTLFKYQDASVSGKISKICTEKKITNMLIDFCVSKKELSDDSPRLKDRIREVHKNIQQCSELPTEWTVLQLCREYNPMKAFMLSKEILKSHDPLCFTLFCYPRSHLQQNEPLCVIYHHHENVFPIIYEMRDMINEKCKANDSNDLNDEIYAKMEKLREFVGPWLILFCGKAKNEKALKHENSIFSLVDEFCSKHDSELKFSKLQQVLISLIARRIDLLVREDTRNQAASHISISPAQNGTLRKFFEDMYSKSVPLTRCEYHPLILVVEETMDFMNWEMCIPSQDSTRVSSLSLLFQLFRNYRQQIRKGYVMIEVKKGFALVNPDKSLMQMQERLASLWTSWAPHFDVLAGSMPSPEDLHNRLKSTDVYIYSGHGNSLQYMNGSKLPDCSVRSVVFLFGCESAALTSRGLQSEMFGANLYLHYAQSPAVVGFNTIITDFLADILTVVFCTSWLPATNGAKCYVPVSDLNWRNSKGANRLTPFSKKTKPTPSLLSVLTSSRCDKDLPLRMRAVFVCRGLPVYNTAAAL